MKNNAIYSYSETSGPAAGEGGGVLAIIDTISNTYIEALKAKTEQRKREAKQHQQKMTAASQLIFRQIKIGDAQSGGKALFGYAINTTGKNIDSGMISIKYWSGKRLVYEDKTAIKMEPNEQRHFGMPLKAISYTGITITPEYVHLSD